jgi:hypothetical protein
MLIPELVNEGWCWWYRKYAPGERVLERLETEARNDSDHGEDRSVFRESRRNQPCRMNHFSISTPTNTIDESSRHSSSSSRERAIGPGDELEERGTLGSKREHVAHLRQRQDGEDHRLPMGMSRAIGPGLGGECHAPHEQAQPENVLPHSLCKDAFARRSGRPLHETFFFRFNRKRQPRQPVGDEVDPQNVNRARGAR